MTGGSRTSSIGQTNLEPSCIFLNRAGFKPCNRETYGVFSFNMLITIKDVGIWWDNWEMIAKWIRKPQKQMLWRCTFSGMGAVQVISMPRFKLGGFPVDPHSLVNSHSHIAINNWLVVWNIFYFPIYWVANHPNWRNHIFQRGGPATNQTSIVHFSSGFTFLGWQVSTAVGQLASFARNGGFLSHRGTPQSSISNDGNFPFPKTIHFFGSSISGNLHF